MSVFTEMEESIQELWTEDFIKEITKLTRKVKCKCPQCDVEKKADAWVSGGYPQNTVDISQETDSIRITL